jgi:Asp-tRNA(Asn)/Glu-tRNA(Gln) amidotransferase A subunit family amidase
MSLGSGSSVSEVARAVRGGEVLARTVVESALQRIEERDREVGAFLWRDAEESRSRSRTTSAGWGAR